MPVKVDGAARFGLDMRFAWPGACGPVPVPDAVLAGVERLVMSPAYAGSTAGFAVVDKRHWHARVDDRDRDRDRGRGRGRGGQWQQRPLGALDSQCIAADLENAVISRDAFVFFKKAASWPPRKRRGHRHALLYRNKVLYRAPYRVHTALKPTNCTARVDQGEFET